MWCSFVAPAAIALTLDAILRLLEVKALLKGGPEMGVAPEAGFWTLLICVFGSLVPALWSTKEQSLPVTIVTWGGLAVLNIAVTVPGCSFIWG